MNGKDYHNLTAYDRRRMTGHALDWDHRPDLYKHYPAAQSVALPQEGGALGTATLWDIIADAPAGKAPAVDLSQLAELLGLGYGITAAVRYPQETFHYRSAPSAGALYPCEIYAAVYDVAGLPPGLYYFSVIDFALKRLRSADIESFTGDNAKAGLALSLFITGIPFRSAWKYRARAFRYVLLDAGHLLGNLALIARGLRWPFRITYDLDTAATGRLLGLDERRETGVARLDVGRREDVFTPAGSLPALPREMSAASRVSDRERVYPEIEQMMAAACPDRAAAADVPVLSVIARRAVRWQAVEPPARGPADCPAARAMLQRRSSRNFIPREIPADQFHSLLSLLGSCFRGGLPTGPTPARYLVPGFIAGAIAGVDPGFYLFDPETGQYTPASAGPLTRPMADACLNQAWLKNAGAHFLFMLDPGRLDETFGPRGYRYAMIQAGFLGQMIYLGTTALGLGSCGIGAIYDEEAQTLLGLRRGSVLGYLVAAGIVKKTK